MPVFSQIRGGLIVGGIIWLIFIFLSYPRKPGVRRYKLQIPESASRSSLAEQAMLAKAHVERQSERVRDVAAFLARRPRSSYLVPRIGRLNPPRPEVLYLGKTEEGQVIYTSKQLDWFMPYESKSLRIEGSTLEVTVVPDWGVFVSQVILGIAIGIIGGGLTIIIPPLL